MTLFKKPYPQSEMELYNNAMQLAGYTLRELASWSNYVMPNDLKRHKGWVGLLLEHCLGAYAGALPEQDFPHLNIELKTLPVNRLGQPLETTFVCCAPLVGNSGITWESSYLKHKLQRVLWIPVEAERSIPLAERRIGSALLWSPSSEENSLLRADWEELIEMIVLGRVHKITAKTGTVLQIRPKAAHSRIVTDAIGEFGEPIKTLPRGFYLKKNFTTALLANHYTLF